MNDNWVIVCHLKIQIEYITVRFYCSRCHLRQRHHRHPRRVQQHRNHPYQLDQPVRLSIEARKKCHRTNKSAAGSSSEELKASGNYFKQRTRNAQRVHRLILRLSYRIQSEF